MFAGFLKYFLNKMMLLVLLLAGISSCGGGNESSTDDEAGTPTGYKIMGDVQGLSGQLTLLLESNGSTNSMELDTNGSFEFFLLLAEGAPYAVSVVQQPSTQQCSVNNATGNVQQTNVSNIVITCGAQQLSQYSVGGMIYGLDGTMTLMLETNEGINTMDVDTNGAFEFSLTVEDNSAYNVSVLTQPSSQNCTVTNARGDISASNISNVAVHCDSSAGTSRYTVAGVLSGSLGNVTLILSSGTLSESLNLTENGSFQFLTSLTNNSTYSIALGETPTNQSCALTNATGTISNQNISDIEVTCTTSNDTPSDQVTTVRGAIRLAANIIEDSDLNDPLYKHYRDNSTFANAQAINNIVSLQGFTTAIPTEREGDMFESTIDRDDYFLVTLQANQHIQLRVVDYDGFDNNEVFEGDLDLYLYDMGGDLIRYSNSTTEYENILVEQAGQYYVNVYAYSGTSKYVLSLSAPGTTPSGTGKNADFLAGEAITKFNTSAIQAKTNGVASVAASALSMKHKDTSRANLVTFDLSASQVSSSSLKTSAPNDLASINPKSFQKFQTLQKIKELQSSPDVKYAYPNYRVYPKRVPNDTYYSLQWQYPAMNLPQAWDITVGHSDDRDIIVAVIDTGIVMTHVDFDSSQFVPGYDFISHLSNSGDGDGIDPDPTDVGDHVVLGRSSWHGTHVAGSIAANTNNVEGMAGVSWGAKIMPLRALGLEGGSTYDIMQSLRYAAGLSNDSNTLPQQPADIINLSLGGPNYFQDVQDLYDELHELGIIVVAAAGNDETDEPSYPASYNNVISVAATDFNGDQAPYSNYGPNVDIAAPGGDVTQDLNNDGYSDGIFSLSIDDTSGSLVSIYYPENGTSMASPHVAGVAALMKAVYPELTAQEFNNLLIAGELTDDQGEAGRDDIYGHGNVNALKAVQAAQRLANGTQPTPSAPSVVASPVAITFGENSVTNLTLTNQGGGSPAISSITSSASWLTVSATSTDAFGLGDYQVSIDKSGLPEGIYSEHIQVNINTGSTLIISVSFTLGSANQNSEGSTIYVFALDANTGDFAGGTIAQWQNDGLYHYEFLEAPAGSYLLFAGSDIDNDNVICQFGESCGVYRSMHDPQVLVVNGKPLENINFNAAMLSGITTQAFSTFNDRETQTPLSTVKKILQK